MSAIPNRRIEGKYEILQKIREGGMGAIYKVRHRLLDEIRVIKLMRPQIADEAEFKARFIREARVAIKLRHPNVAHLYDFTLGDDDTAFIVMEFIDGRTLEELLRAVGPPPLGLALEIAQQSLRALGYLHGKGFVHRDISPDNLMLAEDPDGNPQVKLIDLGIAKVVGGDQESQLTQTGTFLGKLRYASPEQFGAGGPQAADARGDLYSFGVVLYELLTGRHPIPESDPSSIITGHLFRPPLAFDESDRRGRLPPALRAAVLKALAKSPDERFASAREFAQALAALRRPDDLRAEEWQEVLRQLAAAAAGRATAMMPAARPSSTQNRLDEHFGATITPAPATLLEVAQAAAEARLPEPAAAVEAPAAEAPAAGAEPAVRAAPALAAAGAPAAKAAAPAASPAAAARRTRTAERRRAGEIERRAAEIGMRLGGGDLDGGEELLAAAEAELGDAEAWRQARTRLAGLRAELRLAEIGLLLMRAHQQRAGGDLSQAIETVGEARRIEPDNPAVRALAGELEEAQARQEKERRRTEKLAQTVASVAAKLERRELADASKLLDWAVARFGPVPALREQWERLEELKRQGVAQRAEELLRDARLLLKVEDHEDAARKLARVLELVPGHPAARALLDQVMKGRGGRPRQ